MSVFHHEALAEPRSSGLAWVRGAGTVIVKAPAALWNTLLVWQDRAIERAHLASLHDEALKDMGIGRADAAREAAKPFWRA